MRTYFTVVAYSGSTCMCQVLQHTSSECGHKHRTEGAARNCLAKLQGWSKDGQSCSATWYHGCIEERNRADDDVVIDDYEHDSAGNFVVNRRLAQDVCSC